MTDERTSFEAWWRDQKWSQFMTKSDALVIWQAATLAERERAAKLLEDQRYMTLKPLRKYTADETWQIVRSSVKHLAAAIRGT
jgi:hypothetical protein